MNKTQNSIYLYVLFSILYLIGTFFGFYSLSFYTKPFIIPSLLLFYFLSNDNKISFSLVLILFFSYVGDLLYLIDINRFYYFGLFIFLLPYTIILFILYKDFSKIISNKKKIDLTFLIILIVLLVLMLTILFMLEVNSIYVFLFYLIFGLQLVLMGVLTSIIHYNESNRANYYLTLASSAFILSDMFFILDKSFFESEYLKIINIFCQTISYFFIVKYFLNKK